MLVEKFADFIQSILKTQGNVRHALVRCHVTVQRRWIDGDDVATILSHEALREK